MSKVYGIACNHALEEADAMDAEVAAKLMAAHNATKQLVEGRALRLKFASSIAAGEAIQVGAPMMVLGNNGEVVELGSDDDSAVAQVVVTPAAWKINKRGNSDAAGTSGNKALCRDLIDSLTKTQQGNAEIEAKHFDFEKQMAEQRFEKEKQDSQRQHELQLRSMDLQKMQMDMQMAEMKIRLAQLEQGGDSKDSSK